MGKYQKLILLIAAILLAFALMTMLGGEKKTNKISIKKNEIIIDNFELAKVIDKDNNFYRLNADTAVINRSDNSAELTKLKVVYKKGETNLKASADKGFLKQEVRMDARGKIEGEVNTFSFETNENGLFSYDFETEKGFVKGDVLLTGKEGSINADEALINHKENLLEFIGNVKVIYNN